MKIKHNKKRNTAFVYEALVREATVSIIKEDAARKDKVVSIIKKHFGADTLLYKDLECYRSLYEEKFPNKQLASRVLNEVKMQKRLIDPDGLFQQQTELIHDINKDLSPDLFNNFVPNYRCLATIEQILSFKTSPKSKIMLENQIMDDLIIVKESTTDMPTIDNLTYRQSVKLFNEKYENQLLKEQKNLLTFYVTSFSDNGLQLKMYLNEEIGRLKEKLVEAKEVPCILEDKDMLAKTNKIIEKLNGFAKQTINENVLLTVLKTQSLVQEIYNGDND